MNGYDAMNFTGYSYSNPTQNNGWGQPRQYNNYAQPMQPPYRLNTNAAFVTSLDEALIKTTERNSDMIYFHQDKNEFYRVKVDVEGRKSWAVFQYILPNQEDNAPATKADIDALLRRIEALEATKEVKIVPKNKKKEVVDGAESDG